MHYDPAQAALKCDYCGTLREVDKRVVGRRDYFAERAHGNVENAKHVYICPNCSSEVELDSFDTAASCPYCGATNIIEQSAQDILLPDSILPFSVAKETALNSGKKYIKRKLFAPRALKKDFRADNFEGTYIPSFVFSADTFSTYEGKLGERRVRTVGTGKNRHTETYYVWYHVDGSHGKVFEDLSMEATKQLSQPELRSILPYDMQMVEAFEKEYIAGFNAESYNEHIDSCFDRAKNVMEDVIKREIVARYNADEVAYLNVNTIYNTVKFRYTLLPLWICRYKYKNKAYRFIVNGRTGRSAGKVPVSPLRVLAAVFIALAAIAAITLGIMAAMGYFA